MPVRRSKYPAPIELPPIRRKVEQLIVHPDDGLRRDVMPQHLPSTAAWVFENLEGDAGGFMVRSGFSRHVATLSSAYSHNWLYAAQFYSPSRGTTVLDANIGVVMSSARTPQWFNFFDPTATSSLWSSARTSNGNPTFQVNSVGTRYFNSAVLGDFGNVMVQILVASNGSEIFDVRTNTPGGGVQACFFRNYA